MLTLQRLPSQVAFFFNKKCTRTLLVNVHSHDRAPHAGFWISSFHKAVLPENTPSFFSAGIHPCYLPENNSGIDWAQLNQLVQLPNCVAIGEVGLHQSSSTDMLAQIHWFRLQVQLANQLNKPLVIHCVRAFAEVLHCLKEENNSVPVIFHGFRKNIVLARQLVEAGHFLSFGAALQHPRIAAIFAALPANSLFLETDESEVPLVEMYNWAAASRKISVEALSLQLRNNASLVFNRSIP